MEMGNMATIVIAAAITIAFVAALKKVVRNAANGKCSGGCQGGCEGCKSCSGHKGEVKTAQLTK